jgi:4-amino-4-deoxy-L-arabinose transferase-like glycosyltransferase
MNRAAKLFLIPIFLLQILFFIWVARSRFVHVDEGFFLLAARLVLMHKKPYVDFFYPQAPLLAYVYALWMKCLGVSWTAGRLLAALLTSLLGTILYRHVCRQTGNWIAGLASVIMFASSTLIFAWFPIVGPYSLAGLFLFSAYAILTSHSAESSPWLLATAGLLLGFSVDTRSNLLLVAPLFLWWLFRNFDARARLNSILWFLGGCLVGVAPCLYLFVPSPDTFLFNNLGYHAIRSDAGLIGMVWEKLGLIIMFLLGGPGGNGIQNSILFFVSLGFVFSIPGRKYPPRLALQIALVVIILSLLPTPAYMPYFCLSIPFLVVSAACSADHLYMSLEYKRERLVAAAACVVLLGIYLGVSVGDFRRYFITGNGVPVVSRAQDREDWRLERILALSQAIDQVAQPGDMVASLSPGDIFQTKTTPFTGFENPFALAISEKLTAQQRTRYHISSPAEIEGDFATHTPRIVVLRDQVFSATTGEEETRRMRRIIEGFRTALLAHGYTLVRSMGGISVYVSSAKS